MAAKELQLLRYLVRHRDRMVPREEMREVWVRLSFATISLLARDAPHSKFGSAQEFDGA